LYVVEKIENIDFYKAFKILYFAYEKHLTQYNKIIVPITYKIFLYSTVPIELYELLKFIKSKITIFKPKITM
jgi:hypothetical protein